MTKRVTRRWQRSVLTAVLWLTIPVVGLSAVWPMPVRDIHQLCASWGGIAVALAQARDEGTPWHIAYAAVARDFQRQAHGKDITPHLTIVREMILMFYLSEAPLSPEREGAIIYANCVAYPLIYAGRSAPGTE